MGITIWGPGMDPKLPRTVFYQNDHPESLVFDKESWNWYKCEDDGSRTKLFGVTGILKVIHKPALLPWGIKVALERMRKLLVTGGYTYPTVDGQQALSLYEDTLDEIIKTAKKTDSEILHDAGDVGHDAHFWLESVVKAIISKDEPRRLELFAKFPIDERASNCAIAAMAFFDAHNVRFLCAERPVYSRTLKAVGTLDALALTDSCDDPACCPVPHKDSLTLLDYKTSNGLYPSMLAQAAFYSFAYMEENPGQHIERRFVIRLGKDDGKFESWHMPGDEWFEADLAVYRYALGLYQSLQVIEDRLTEIAANAKAIHKAAETLVKDAEYAIRCPESEIYKGMRRKKGCNGKEKMCEACAKIYLDKHPVI
jgi:hypothetical protein